jgi:DNA-binding NarL/FixJ family response regulator
MAENQCSDDLVPSTTTVFVVTDVLLYREGLREILERHPDIAVVGTSATVAAGIGELAARQPQVVLVDTPADGAIADVAAIRRAFPRAGVVVLGLGDDEREIVAWAEAGVSGYVTRDESLLALVDVIRGVGRQELICSPRLAATLLRRVADLAGRSVAADPKRVLTAREREVLERLECGLSNKEIARDLSIALSTVKNHVHSILDKLQARGRCDAVAWLHGTRTMAR